MLSEEEWKGYEKTNKKWNIPNMQNYVAIKRKKSPHIVMQNEV